MSSTLNLSLSFFRRLFDRSHSTADRVAGALGIWSGARLTLGLLPEARRRIAFLTALGAATSVLDTVVIGLVILLVQFAFGAVEPVQGYGALGIVANFAYRLSTLDVWFLGAIVFFIVLTHSLLGASYEGLTSHLRLQAYQTFRERVFANWVEGDLQSDAKRGPGAMINAIQNETWEAADAVFDYCTLAIASAITLFYLLVMIATSPVLTGVAAALSPLAVLAVGIVRTRLWERSQASIGQKEDLARHLIGNLSALRTIKAFRAEAAAVQRSRELSFALRRTFESIVVLETALKPLADVVNILVLGSVLLVAWALGYPGAITLGFIILLYRAQPRALVVYQTLGRLARTQPSVLAVAQLMEPPQRPALGGDRVFTGIEREIRFDSVSYAYQDARAPAVHGLDFVLSKGEMTVVLGPSGAGKSTLINLLLRFVEPQRGALTCDGEPIASFSRASWLSRVAVAGQDVELIDGSIRDNLRIGNPQATERQIWQALETAGVADVVRGLPRGLDAEVGSRGVNLSGGQRQRICLARALMVYADLLILDEATNAVDAMAEQAIYARIRLEYPEQTLLVVAHRAEIGRIADRVVVLADGKVVGSGAPETILGRSGRAHPSATRRSDLPAPALDRERAEGHPS